MISAKIKASVIKKVLCEVVDGTIIEGGHFLLNKKGEPILNKESTFTFELAATVFLKAEEHGKKVALSFLVDDLSVSPTIRSKANASFTLPSTYLAILKKSLIDPTEVKFYFESTLRNRGSRKIKSALKKNLIIETGDSFRLNPLVYGVLCDDEISNQTTDRKKRVANCRLIVAQGLQDKELRGYKKSINFCNQDVFKCTGRYAAVYQNLLGGKMTVVNVYVHTNEGKTKIEIQKYNTNHTTTFK